MRRCGRTTAGRMETEILSVLLAHHWPGNVRELKNSIETLATHARYKNRELLDGEFSPLLRGLLPGELIETSAPIDTPVDFKTQLAISELRLVREGIKKIGKKKQELYLYLKYPSRFTFLRRIKRIFAAFPDLQDEFRDVYNLFSG
jgi:transcriptional regulator with AAA-type ATPase domain